jgi:hypothetical protein
VKLKPGTRLHSQVDGTEVMVVRPLADDLRLSIDGTPLVLREAKPLPAND